jgi:rhodanese-related sulfurtransferase
MKSTHILYVVVAVLLVGNIVFFLNARTDKENTTETNSVVAEKQAPETLFEFEEKTFDFGVIKQSGGKVKHDFEFTYNGTEPLQITGVPTSCACTSASVNPTKLNQGDEGVLTVTFNPNLHEEPEGRFFKTVTLLTEPSVKYMPEVKIWAEIELDLGPEAYELQSDHDDSEEEEDHGLGEYQSITPAVFEQMNADKDFVLIDVHIPEQAHIDGTDAFIPYKDIAHSAQLPKDKDAKIVLYCRSGGMSRAAAYTLAEEGYTNVYDLSGGKNAYDAYKRSQ